jgi:hypothetical protein
MGFKIGDNVAVDEDGEPSRVGRIVSYLGDACFEIAVDGDEGNPRKVRAQSLRHLDSVRMRIAPIKR